MPFLTRCPYCGLQARVPDNAAGISLACPRCHDSFTVAPQTSLPDSPELNRTGTVGTPNGESHASVTAVEAPPAAAQATRSSPSLGLASPVTPAWPTESEATPGQRRQINLLGLAALQAGALGLIAAAFPLTALFALPLAGVGMALGLVGTLKALATDRISPLALCGAGLSLVALVVPVLWPSLVRVGPTGRPAPASDAKRIDAIPLDHRADSQNLVDAAGWADASRAVLMQNGVRVQIESAEIAPLPLKPMTRGQPPLPASAREKYLLVRVQLSSVGASRAVKFFPWGGLEKDASPPVLTEAGGKPLHQATFDRELGILGRLLTATEIWPGRSVEELLVFERPGSFAEVLHLELPAAAIGNDGTFRFALPKNMIRR